MEIIGLRDLKADPQNARKHTPRNVAMVVDALQEVEAARSIVIDEKGVVLAGNATIKALVKRVSVASKSLMPTERNYCRQTYGPYASPKEATRPKITERRNSQSGTATFFQTCSKTTRRLSRVCGETTSCKRSWIQTMTLQKTQKANRGSLSLPAIRNRVSHNWRWFRFGIIVDHFLFRLLARLKALALHLIN